MHGYRVGGGVEFALNNQLSLKVEYRYSDSDGLFGAHSSQEVGGISYRFGHGVAEVAHVGTPQPFSGWTLGYDSVRLGSRSDSTRDGVVWGGGIGRDFRMGRLILGAELKATDSSVSFGDNEERVDIGRDLYAGGRVGYVAGRVLIYAKGGVSNLRISDRFDDEGDTSRPPSTSTATAWKPGSRR